ncbi:MurR/RpiR family transcriptional regulator [Pantoea cypripedii]|uniref:MurR/RpiR family transcriptional regulator n=1 Tax=Pantoea cypripedii TaxID=55209 RepID=A0A6B9GAL6_PANCY|nr:MurR/RpiR family transcriptional regulator [Pantoea cypripedii]QGY32863.1 MurR/RpiR family transcriptional regulator [Pantoea cypripedii]
MLAQQIKDSMAELSPAERKIARAMLADYPRAGLGTVQTLADQAGVSLPSVVRFARRMGFGGFVDFQQALRDEISEQAKGPLQRLENWVTNESPSALIEAAIKSSVLAIQYSLRDIPEYEITEATRLIGAKEHHVMLGGGRISQSLAMYFGRNLQQVRRGVDVLSENHHDRIQQIIDANKNDVFVLFDFRRYQQDMYQLAQEIVARGATLIAITDTQLSPIASLAKVVLPIHVETPWLFDGYSAGIVLIDAIIAAIMENQGDKTVERLKQWEALGPLSLNAKSK